MLGVGSYSIDYIQTCAKAVDAQLAKFAALADFTGDYLRSQVVALDHMFMHRLRGKEGKDGNPANEVRMLAVSILENNGVMKEDKTIKYNASKSATGIAVGDRIELTPESFGKLADAYFSEIAAKFV